MIFKSLKESIINSFDKYIEDGLDKDPEAIIEAFLGYIEESIDQEVLNGQETEEGYAIMMGKLLLEVPDLLSYSIGDLFDELIENEEDCLAYVFSQALISYTIREMVLHYHSKGLFTEDMLKVLGITPEFLNSPENPYRKTEDNTGDDFDPELQKLGINQKYLH